MKKKIIVPVDLSPTSHNAYLYALGLAEDLNASIEVIYVHTMADRDRNESFPDKMEDMEGQLSDFVNLYARQEQEDTAVFTKVKLTKRVLIGYPVKSILHACQNPADTIFVMGMTGSHNAIGRYFGTVSSAIAQKAKCPVLLIPARAKYIPYKNILLASNYDSADREKLKQITDFASFFKAGIHFVHIREKGEVEEFTETEERIFARLFEEGDPGFSFSLTAIEAPSIAKGLSQYADENEIDLLTLVKSRKGFLKLLLNKSITKKIAFNSKLPLLVLHFTN